MVITNMSNVQSEILATYIRNVCEHISGLASLELTGKIIQIKGSAIEVVGLELAIGSQCYIAISEKKIIEALVVSLYHDRIVVLPLTGTEGINSSSRVYETPPIQYRSITKNHNFSNQKRSGPNLGELQVGHALLGRVIDGWGKPLDSHGEINTNIYRSLNPKAVNPLEREPIRDILDVGVKAINGTLTIGRGQRVGIFAGSGVGKSVLLGMMTRYTSAQVVVVALIGERGREVREFIEESIGAVTLGKCVTVVAAADSPAQTRVQAAKYACTVAEYFREQGIHVLLIMDSLTRYAMAHREIALSIGELPATKGYPASVFTKLPALVERAGNGPNHYGSITAFYTVLAEGDDQQDPIADSARAILDGHIVLDRVLAESGHYPAIDITQSISRVMDNIIGQDHKKIARKIRQLKSTYKKNADILSVGAYISGNDKILDEAIVFNQKIDEFLTQEPQDKFDINQSLKILENIF
jgi:flagellum-specific ATP synthase